MCLTNEQIEQAVVAYLKLRPKYEEFAQRIEQLLRLFLKQAKQDFDHTESRAKEEESFREKARDKREKYGDPLLDMKDLAGCRIVTFYTDDVARIVSIIRNEFDVDEANSVDKAEEMGDQEFGYLSVHLVVSLNEDRAKLQEWGEFAGLQVEIQVRTLAQHAWAAAEHKLDYKRKGEIPPQFHRDFYVLAAMFEHADSIWNHHKDIINTYPGKLRGDLSKIPINLDSLKSYLDEQKGRLEQAALKAGIVPVDQAPENRRLIRNVHELLYVLQEKARFSVLADLDSVLREAEKDWGNILLQRLHDVFDKKEGSKFHLEPVALIHLFVAVARPDKYRLIDESGGYDKLIHQVVDELTKEVKEKQIKDAGVNRY